MLQVDSVCNRSFILKRPYVMDFVVETIFSHTTKRKGVVAVVLTCMQGISILK